MFMFFSKLEGLGCYVHEIFLNKSPWPKQRYCILAHPAMACCLRPHLAVYESVFVIDNERLVHKVNELKFMVIATSIYSHQHSQTVRKASTS